jgi:hypothetical protein
MSAGGRWWAELETRGLIMYQSTLGQGVKTSMGHSQVPNIGETGRIASGYSTKNLTNYPPIEFCLLRMYDSQGLPVLMKERPHLSTSSSEE